MIMAKEETLRRLIQVEVEIIEDDIWGPIHRAAQQMRGLFGEAWADTSGMGEEEYDQLISRLGSSLSVMGSNLDVNAMDRGQQELLLDVMGDWDSLTSLLNGGDLADVDLDSFLGTFGGLGGDTELTELFGRLQHGGQTAEEILEEGLMGNRPKTTVEYLEAIWKALTIEETEDGREIDPINVILTDILHAMQIANALAEVQIAQLAHMTTSLTSPSWDVAESAWMDEMDAKMATVDMPQFAKGGIATSASIFGEAGPEAAVPLPDGRTIPVTLSGQHMPPINLIAPEAGNSDELKAGLAELQRELHELRIEQQRQHNASYRVQKDQLFIEEKREERGMPPPREITPRDARGKRTKQPCDAESAE
jgi:hypothetical protein